MAKIMIAKVGTDAHDMGITVIERWLSDAGHEVVNLGLYNSPKRVAEQAAREKPDIVGLSFLGGEPVYLDGRCVGVSTSGAYGHYTGKSLAFAYVEAEKAKAGTQLGIDLLGERCVAHVLSEPVYDPNNQQMRK